MRSDSLNGPNALWLFDTRSERLAGYPLSAKPHLWSEFQFYTNNPEAVFYLRWQRTDLCRIQILL